MKIPTYIQWEGAGCYAPQMRGTGSGDNPRVVYLKVEAQSAYEASEKAKLNGLGTATYISKPGPGDFDLVF